MDEGDHFWQFCKDHFGDLIKVKSEDKAMVGSDTDLGQLAKLNGIPMSRFGLDSQGAYYGGGGGSAGTGVSYGSGGCSVASYPPVPQIKQPDPITTTQAWQGQDFNEAALEKILVTLEDNGHRISRPVFGPRVLSATEAQALNRVLVQREATIKAKDEIIAGLRDQLEYANSLNGALERDNENLSSDRDRLIVENEANKAATNMFREKANERFQQYVDANEARLELERYAKTLEATIAELNRQLENEPKPNARDTSRLGHFGESHAKNGLALFDRYY